MERTKPNQGDTLPEKGQLQLDILGVAAAEGVNQANPSGTKVSEKGNSDKSGNAPEYGDCAPNFTGRAETDMEWLTPNDMGDSLKEIMPIPEELHVVSNLKAEGNVSLHGFTRTWRSWDLMGQSFLNQDPFGQD